MILLLMSLLLAWTPFAQEAKDIAFDVRARENLLMGRGAATSRPYYDVVITQQPAAGVLLKLPYTKKGGKFSFDLHHRIAMTEDYGLKTITLDIKPGPQSLSIVGQMAIITRGKTTTRIDTPGTRIAVVSNFKFQEIEAVTPLK